MWICPVCKKECEDDSLYCIVCGTRNPEAVEERSNSLNYSWYCPTCRNLCAGSSKNCEKCGTPRPDEENSEKTSGPENYKLIAEPLIKRGMMDLADGDFYSAENLFKQVLDKIPNSAAANLGMFMAENGFTTEDVVKDKLAHDFNNELKNSVYWRKAKSFADEGLRKKLDGWEVNQPEKKPDHKKIILIAAPIAAVCVVFIILLITVIIPGSKYRQAVTLYNNGKYEKAMAVFEGLDGYKDSASKIKKCKTAIQDEQYADALCLYEDGDYEEALAVFEELDGYKNSAAKVESCRLALICESLRSAKIGDTIIFGSYEQDNDTSNGKEAIEWTVLDKKDGKALVISSYALDRQPYNTKYTAVTWEACSLRKWLNSTFIDAAFTSSEQELIPDTLVTADANPEYDTDVGNDTTDKVFVLSIDEAYEYFSSDGERKCVPTEYVIAQGAWSSDEYLKDGSDTCWYWLRSTGVYCDCTACVIPSGSVFSGGHTVHTDGDCVRPALWINFES